VTECPHCHEDIALANPSGFCSHVYYPDNCAVCSAPERARLRLNAAAPDLLEAAKAAVARQVINNWVTAGEWVCRNCGEMPGEHAHDEGCWVALCNAAIAAAEGVE